MLEVLDLLKGSRCKVIMVHEVLKSRCKVLKVLMVQKVLEVLNVHSEHLST